MLYDDPVDGYPPAYARDGIPKIDSYYDGSSTPTPEDIDFTPGELLGSVSGELGLRSFLEERGHQLTVTSDKDGPDSVFERELPEAEIVISQPFWPAYLTAERIAKAPNLKLAVTAGIGSDHVDLQAAIDRGLTVAEVSYSNSISVSEHVVMMILALVRNYIPSHQIVLDGGWNIADAVSRSYDLEGMQVGTVGAGRIGSAVLRRLKPFEVGLHYTDRHRLPSEVEAELGVTYHETPEELVARVRRRHDQRAAPSRDGAPLRRGDDRPDEARGVSREHGARQDLRPRRRRPRVRERPARGLCGRRLVPAARAPGSSVAHDAEPRHDAAHFGHEPLGPGPLRRGRTRDPRVLVRRPADPRGVSDRRRRPTGRRGRAFVQRRGRDRRLRRGRSLQGAITSDELLNVWDYERAAEERLDPAAFGYFAGGADDEWTLRENVAAFGRWVLRPRVLVDVSHVSAAATVLGTEVSLPVLVAPMAFQGRAHPDGEKAMARGAEAAGTVDVPLDGVDLRPRGCGCGGFERRPLVPALLGPGPCAGAGPRRARGAAGYRAIVLTVDFPEVGRRERELRASFERPKPLNDIVDRSLTWPDLEWLRSTTSLPLLVKGILTAEDAELACEAGVEGIVVSNHGGRQLDGVAASLDALPEVVESAGDRAEILLDGGIRRGTDVVKALALGARAVLVGRAALYGLAVGGAEGVERVLGLLRAEVELALALCGCATPADVTRAHVGRV